MAGPHLTLLTRGLPACPTADQCESRQAIREREPLSADDSASLPVRGALATNLDPLFLRGDYFDKLADIRWGKGRAFIQDGADWRIANRNLHYLYNAVFAFNEPVTNDPLLTGVFDIAQAEQALVSGKLSSLLAEWNRPRD